MSNLRRAVVFLDWDTARRIAPRPRVAISDVRRAARQIETVFTEFQSIVARHLRSLDSKAIFRVRWRLYHGWYSGLTKTADYLAVERYLSEAGTRTIDNVSFGVDIEVASSLLVGGRRMPLYDSLRQLTEPDGEKIVRQKMVDTGLVCDLLHSTRSSREDVHLVYGDDDDILPGIFTAEAWGAKVHMYRPDAGSRHLNTRNIVTVLGGLNP